MTVGIVIKIPNKFRLCAVLIFQMGIWQNFEVPNYILIRQTVSLIRKAVPHRHNYADRHNPITYVIQTTPYLHIGRKLFLRKIRKHYNLSSYLLGLVYKASTSYL